MGENLKQIAPVLPNFLIVGAAKCGTTSLYYYLKQHPDVFIIRLTQAKVQATILDLENILVLLVITLNFSKQTTARRP